jgi:hypothetical protein
MKNYAIIAIVLLAMGAVFAVEQITTALEGIRSFFCMIMPALMLVCFLLAAIIYAAGQMASADQRARFHGWATSLLIGGITCGIIVVLAPWIIGLFMPSSTVAACY